MNKLWILFLCLPLPAADVHFVKALEQASSGDCALTMATLSASSESGAEAGAESDSLPAFCQETLPKYDEAIRSARAALAKDPGSPPLELALGKLLLRQKPEDPEAGALLARAAGAMPGNPEARHYYAQWAYLNDRDRV
jgi:tetratricopeptide (TPR) repeat protein